MTNSKDEQIREDERRKIASWIRSTSSIWAEEFRQLLEDLADQIDAGDHNQFFELMKERDLKMNIEELRNSKNWKEFSVKNHLTRSSASYAFQRKIKDDNGLTLYFINAYFYDFSKYGQGTDKNIFDIEVDLFPENISASEMIRLTFSVSEGIDVSQIENQIRIIYSKIGCRPDIHNN